MKLLPIPEDGKLPDLPGPYSDLLASVIEATMALYRKSGYHEPWISFVAAHEGEAIGICSFKSAPVNGRVEIAYFTFPEHEDNGHATAMAEQLVGMARRHDPTVAITAQTLPERNASHRVLEKLGFRALGSMEHPEDGIVLEWQLRG